jgi:malate dehydrogenase (oxaloacetate-decarboxylating)(NADP+)
MNIPVFHDDQHGTAIISGAALLNALELVGKRIEDVRVVFSGAGASAIATAPSGAPASALRAAISIVEVADSSYETARPMNSVRRRAWRRSRSSASVTVRRS